MNLEKIKGLFNEASLYSSEEEMCLIIEEIQDDLAMARQLADLDLREIQALNIITDNTIELRKDIPEEGMDREEALSYANEREYGYIKIKKVLD